MSKKPRVSTPDDKRKPNETKHAHLRRLMAKLAKERK